MLKSDKQLDVNRALITEMSQRMKGRSCIRLRREETWQKMKQMMIIIVVIILIGGFIDNITRMI